VRETIILCAVVYLLKLNQTNVASNQSYF